MALLTSASKAPRVFKSAIKTMGYGLWVKRGLGGTVTQATNRTTGVTFDTSTNRGKLCGTITTSSASLAAEAAAEFTVTDKACGVNDVVVTCQQSGSNGGNTDVFVSGTAEGSFKIKVANNNPAAGTAETGAILINFIILKSVIN
jgi:hypothetical protein